MSARKAEGSSSAGAQEPGSAAAGVAGSAGAAEVNWVALDRVFERAARADTRGEVPSAFTCPLTMEVFRDPVVSKSGHTYERAALTEHIAKVGTRCRLFGPAERQTMISAELNSRLVGLREMWLATGRRGVGGISCS
jgi:STIP1 family protein 1